MFTKSQTKQLAMMIAAALQQPTAAPKAKAAPKAQAKAPSKAKAQAAAMRKAKAATFVEEVVKRHGDEYVALAAAGKLDNMTRYGQARAQVGAHFGITSKPALKEFGRKHGLLTLEQVQEFAKAKKVPLKLTVA